MLCPVQALLKVICYLLQLWTLDRLRHILLVSMHHAITDGLSITIMKTELAQAYAAVCSGAQPSWQPLPVQFADYATWQRSHLQLDEDLAWWTATLAGAPPLLELPYDRPRPDVFSHRGANIQLTVPGVTSSSLAQLAVQHQTTPFVVALTALQVCGFRSVHCKSAARMPCLSSTANHDVLPLHIAGLAGEVQLSG